MNYGEVKTQFTGTLNRRDITSSQVDTFLKHALQRTQRLLRVTAAETTHTITVAASDTRFPIPGDLLKLVSIRVDDGDELSRVDLSTALRHSKFTGTPRFFCRDGFDLLIGPLPTAGSEITIQYLADFSALSADTDVNWLTTIAPDIIVAGAMVAACLKYNDPRGTGYENAFVTAIADLNLQSTDDELTNAQIMPAYSLDFDY